MAEEKIKVEKVEFVEFSGSNTSNSEGNSRKDVAALADLKLNMTALLGTNVTTLGEIETYEIGDILEVDRMPGHNVDIYIGKEKIAIGEIVVAESNFGISITEIYNKNGEFLKSVGKNGEVG